jgi:uncharacterized surface protein with fasciclin (FAS1) repeats
MEATTMFPTRLAAGAISGLALSVVCASVATAQSTTCVDVIARDPQLSRASSALERTGIAEGLRNSGPFTIFVPTDQAIARHPSDLSERLFPQGGSGQGGQMMDPVAAPAAVNAHILDGRHPASEFRAGTKLPTRNGTTIDVASAQGGQITLSPTPGRFSLGMKPEQAKIIQGDIACSNGIIHKVDDVLVR